MIEIPESHPRAKSLHVREALVAGFQNGLVAPQGLIAHGRGEAFDYLLGEATTPMARAAIRAAAASLLTAMHPVISVNGNAAALVPGQLVELAASVNAKLEVNLFHRTEERERRIRQELERNGATQVLGTGGDASAQIPELQSERRRVDPAGIFSADVVFVPLEDGDRTEALVKMGKTVITVDLNPISRTAKAAQISIVDNLVRAVPELVAAVADLKKSGESLQALLDSFDNQENLARSLQLIRGGVG
ncbi:MAG: 4-phosphopantoate--beta-alanine ligase [Nitrososphaera sp.]|jgi:4-phosphopantoate--beta-alanine ligase